MPDLLVHALAYAEKGWPVFPCRVGDKPPMTANGLKAATTDRDQIVRWWSASPEANIGFVTGEPSGLYVIDLDGSEGIGEWEALCVRHRDAPTLTAQTGGGGIHLYYSIPTALYSLGNTAKKIGAQIDTRGTGGYVLLPPSRTANPYQWLIESQPAMIPAWIVAVLTGVAEGRRPAPIKPTAHPYRATRDDALAMRILGEECDVVRSTAVGARNHTLFKAACNMASLAAGGELRDETAIGALHAAALACGLDEVESARTIGSAWRIGVQSPRVIRTRQRGGAGA